MRFTKVAPDAFQKFQLNAGILLTGDYTVGTTPDTSKIFAATSGGTNFTATPEFEDYGEDVDNVPPNTKELKVLKSVDTKMSGTLKTVDTATAKSLMAAADVDAQTGKITPRADLKDADFADLWWIGDYSDKNGETNGGYMAIHLISALSTGGFQLQSSEGKGEFAFEYTGHYTITDITKVPYEVWVKPGTDE